MVLAHRESLAPQVFASKALLMPEPWVGIEIGSAWFHMHHHKVAFAHLKEVSSIRQKHPRPIGICVIQPKGHVQPCSIGVILSAIDVGLDHLIELIDVVELMPCSPVLCCLRSRHLLQPFLFISISGHH